MNVASLVERKTRFAVLFRNNECSSTHLMNKLMMVLEPLSQPARKSITFDRGIEVRDWRKLKPGIGTEAWLSSRSAPMTAAFGSPQVRTSYVLHAVSESCSQVFRNGLTYLHDRDASSHQIDDALRSVCWKVCLSNASSRWIEGFSGLEQGVHDDCKFAGKGHGRALEAKPFTQLQAPGLEIAFGFGAGSRWHRCRRRVEQATQTVGPYVKYGRQSPPLWVDSGGS